MESTDAVYMNFEKPEDRPGATKPPGGTGTHPWDAPPNPDAEAKEATIARLPERDPAEYPTDDRLVRGVSNRNRTAAKLWAMHKSYDYIAERCDFPSAAAAKRAVESVISATLVPEEIETMRLKVVQTAETLLADALEMAKADHLVDGDGTPVENVDRLRWHAQASAVLRDLAMYTGAKAPTKVEFTPGEAEMERLVNQMLAKAGHQEVLEADVIELHVMPAIERGEDDWTPPDTDDEDEDG